MRMCGVLIGTLVLAGCAAAQQPEYDFYRDFRNVWSVRERAGTPSISPAELLERYAARLRGEGLAEAEVARRLRLLANQRPALEADYWSRFYTGGKANYNRAPNAFLVETVAGRKPGAALDYGMGDGRNALHLARLGWRVWGFDPAAGGVALAEKRAKAEGLTLHAVAAPDSQYDFGRERFDLILFSWTMPLVPVERVTASLKPGGMVVMECGDDFKGRNGMLRLFDGLRIERYELVRAVADFYDRRETDVVRLIARRP
jgi:SAM-dependent methyltransferase